MGDEVVSTARVDIVTTGDSAGIDKVKAALTEETATVQKATAAQQEFNAAQAGGSGGSAPRGSLASSQEEIAGLQAKIAASSAVEVGLEERKLAIEIDRQAIVTTLQESQQARLDGDITEAAALEREATVMAQMLAYQTKLNLGREEALALAEQQVALDEADAAAQAQQAEAGAASQAGRVYGRGGMVGNMLRNLGLDAAAAITVGISVMIGEMVKRVIEGYTKAFEQVAEIQDKGSAHLIEQEKHFKDQIEDLRRVGEGHDDINRKLQEESRMQEELGHKIEESYEKQRELEDKLASTTHSRFSKEYLQLSAEADVNAEHLHSYQQQAAALQQIEAELQKRKVVEEDITRQIDAQKKLLQDQADIEKQTAAIKAQLRADDLKNLDPADRAAELQKDLDKVRADQGRQDRDLPDQNLKYLQDEAEARRLQGEIDSANKEDERRRKQIAGAESKEDKKDEKEAEKEKPIRDAAEKAAAEGAPISPFSDTKAAENAVQDVASAKTIQELQEKLDHAMELLSRVTAVQGQDSNWAASAAARLKAIEAMVKQLEERQKNNS